MRLFCLSTSLLFSLAFVMGCSGGMAGSGTAKDVPSPIISSSDSAKVKTRLEGIAQSGSVGSALAGLREAIQKLPADKSGPLLKDLDDLQKGGKPQVIKDIAKRMIDKL